MSVKHGQKKRRAKTLLSPSFPRAQSLPNVKLRPNSLKQQKIVAKSSVGRLNLRVGGCALVDPIYQCEKTIMIRCIKCFVLAGVVLTAASVGTAPAAYAQCDTCATPTVAYYQPTVAYQPVATQQVRTGWYPGRWFDRMRMRRWGVSTAATPTYAAGYAPAGYARYGAAYAAYTAAYACTPTSYTAAYRPYVTS